MTTHRDKLAWVAVGAAAITAVSPWVQLRWRSLTMTRSLMPWTALSAIPVAVRAATHGHRRLAVASCAVGVAGAAMSAPMLVRRRQPDVEPAATALTIAHCNLLYINRRVAAVAPALAALDADVLTFSEVTRSHADTMRRSDLAAGYPYRIELPARGGSGTALWSRYPLAEHSATITKHHTVIADVAAPGGVIRVIVVHTQSPIVHHHQWEADLDQLGGLVTDGPSVMTGDFNASWWHPELRRLMRRGGWRDAHIERGRGLSCSWPTDQWHAMFRWHPPFVRLDHALVNAGIAVRGIRNFDIPGSDHRGLTVTVQRAARPAP
ncbi:MAG: endonuclease/exonuclease/phosphatase family protein [Ilumatobacteraceae bacterium]